MRWWVAWLAMLAATAAAQQPGAVTERVVTMSDAAQSYALYLPSSYAPQKRWPVIFAFDPGARGKVPVELFRAAAEARGYIVAGSNNSRNGPIKPEMQAFAAMLEDVQRRFSIDTQRMYTAGFSGGARVAGMASIVCPGCIRAVIACGAGLPLGLTAEQQAQLPPFFWAVGKEDFNYFEVLDAARSLRDPRRLVVFEGQHQWLPAETAGLAIEWLDAGTPATEIPQPAASEEKERKQQAELSRAVALLLATAARQASDREQNLEEARREMAALRARRQKAKPAEVTVYRRALGQVLIQSYEMANAFQSYQKPALAARCFEVAAEGAADASHLRFAAASSWAAAGEKKKSLAALRRAVQSGFHDGEALAADRHFDALRGLPEFQSLAAAMQQ